MVRKNYCKHRKILLMRLQVFFEDCIHLSLIPIAFEYLNSSAIVYIATGVTGLFFIRPVKYI